MDAVTLLAEDHERVRRLLSELEEALPAQGIELLSLLDQEVRAHSHAEEELFYPAMRDAAEDDEERQQVAEAYEEHHAVDVLFTEIKQAEPGTERFKAKLAVLKEMIEHHAQEEEQEMFPDARERFSTEELGNLGTEIAKAKEEFRQEHSATDRGFMQAKAAGASARRVKR